MNEFGRDLFMDFDEMRRQMERLLEHFSDLKRPPGRFTTSLWEPSVDVYETDDEVVVLAEMAGVDRERAKVTVDGRTLMIRGERRLAGRGEGRRYHQMEICFGPFERTIDLPADVDPDLAKATYLNGFLEVTLRKTQGPHVTGVIIEAEE